MIGHGTQLSLVTAKQYRHSMIQEAQMFSLSYLMQNADPASNDRMFELHAKDTVMNSEQAGPNKKSRAADAVFEKTEEDSSDEEAEVKEAREELALLQNKGELKDKIKQSLRRKQAKRKAFD